MDQANKIDPNEAGELFLWIVNNPDDEERKDKLALAFDKDPDTVLKAVDIVANNVGLYPHHLDAIEGPVPTWRNCIGQQPSLPLEWRFPQSLADLVGIVKDAAAKKAPVRAVGSGHSFSDITSSQDAFLVDPHQGLDQVFSVDASILNDGAKDINMIRAQCGITVANLNQQLDARNLGLINMGAYDGQTISGAMSTGTHGSGLNYGPMADYLLSIVLVTETGKVYQIEPSPSSGPITSPSKFPGHLPECPDIPVELKQDDDWFRTAKVAMGCLGIIYSYTIQVQPAFSLSEVRTMTTWETIKQQFNSSPTWPPPILTDTNHFELLINPYPEDESATPQTHNCVQVKRERLNPPPVPQRGARLSKFDQWLEEISVSHSHALVVLLNHVPQASHFFINKALGFLPTADAPYVDISHKVFTLGIENTVPAWALELHFDAADNCVGMIDKVLDAFATLARAEGWYIAGPIGVRFVAKSDSFLAPEAGRVTCTVECDMLKGIKNDRNLLGRVKEVVCGSVAGVGDQSVRVHWGLDWGFTTAEDLRSWYPGLGKWQAVYREVNATGMFDNSFTQRLRLRE